MLVPQMHLLGLSQELESSRASRLGDTNKPQHFPGRANTRSFLFSIIEFFQWAMGQSREGARREQARRHRRAARVEIGLVRRVFYV